MMQSFYSPLPTDCFTIRLLRLSPSPDRTSPVHCKVAIYPLSAETASKYPYEALSYAWGNGEKCRSICVEAGRERFEVQTTQNLHDALVQLREPYFERIIWVDALCINQKDDKEKSHQVGAMARIYGLAKRVIVWLGEERDDSSFAFETLARMAREDHIEAKNGSYSGLKNMDRQKTTEESSMSGLECEIFEKFEFPSVDTTNFAALDIRTEKSRNLTEEQRNRYEQAIFALLDRAYFCRIWVLQELAAAREILLRCGEAALSGRQFRNGLVALEVHSLNEQSSNQSRILAILALFNDHSVSEEAKGTEHLNILPLTELVDMFHAHEATDRRDKVYALLGMCSDHEEASCLAPDYSKEWPCIFEDLGRFILGNEDSFFADHDGGVLCIRSEAFILGTISKISHHSLWDQNQTFQVTATTPYRSLNDMNHWVIQCRLPKSTTAIQNGDIAILSKTTRKFMIVRPEQLFFSIVMITESHRLEIEHEDHHGLWLSWQPFLEKIHQRVSQLTLVWDWREKCAAVEFSTQASRRLWQLDDIDHDEISPLFLAWSAMVSTYDHIQEFDCAVRSACDLLQYCETFLGLEHQLTNRAREEYIGAERKASNYSKISLMVPHWAYQRTSGLDPPVTDQSLWQICSDILGMANLHIPHGKVKLLWDSTSSDYPGPHTDWTKYLSKFLANGIDRSQLLYTASILYPKDLAALYALMPRDTTITQEILLAAAQNYNFDTWAMVDIIKASSSTLDGFLKILQKLSNRRCVDLDQLLSSCSESLGASNSVSSAVIETALQVCDLSITTLEYLVDAAADNLVISEAMIETLVTPQRGNHTRAWTQSRPANTYGDQMALLLSLAPSDLEISEEIMIKLAGNGHCGVPLLDAIFASGSYNLNFTERVLLSAVRANVVSIHHSILPSLRYIDKVYVTDSVINAAQELVDSESEWYHFGIRRDILDCVIALKEARPIAEREVEEIAARGLALDMFHLIQHHRHTLKITRRILEAAVSRLPPLVANTMVGTCDIVMEPVEHFRLIRFPQHETASQRRIDTTWKEERNRLRDNALSMIALLFWHAKKEDLVYFVHARFVAERAALVGGYNILEVLRRRQITQPEARAALNLIAEFGDYIYARTDLSYHHSLFYLLDMLQDSCAWETHKSLALEVVRRAAKSSIGKKKNRCEICKEGCYTALLPLIEALS